MKWYDASVCRPSTSREVLAARMNGEMPSSVQNVSYSVKFNAFNAQDYDDSAEHAIDIDYWADLPTLEEMLDGK